MKRHYCINNNCTMADVCLRHTMLKKINDNTTMFGIVNPAKVTGDCNCQFYFPPITVRYAKGFLNLLDNMPTKKMEAFRSNMIDAVPRTHYFLMRRGAMLISPKRQQLIRDLLNRLDYECEDPFDAYEEVEAW